MCLQGSLRFLLHRICHLHLVILLAIIAAPVFGKAGREQERYVVEWFNFGEYSQGNTTTQLVVEEIEKRFPVELTLSGGPLGSDGSMELLRRAGSSAKMPDVFPWFKKGSSHKSVHDFG